jgi:hypothetical protein
VTARKVQEHLRSLGSPEAAASALRFCKTGPGQYAVGDIFLGLRAAVMHQLAKEYSSLLLADLWLLLRSAVHEDRALSLLILARRASRGDETTKKEVYTLYLAHTKYVNNWDLVDASARDRRRLP